MKLKIFMLSLFVLTITLTSCLSMDLNIRDMSIDNRFLKDDSLSYDDLLQEYRDNSPESSEGFARVNLLFEGFNYDSDDVESFVLKYELKPEDKSSGSSEGIYKITFTNLEEKYMRLYVHVFLREDTIMWNFAIIDTTYFNYGYYTGTINYDGSPASFDVTIDEENSLMRLDIETFGDDLEIRGYTIFPIPGGSIEAFKELLSEPTYKNN